MRTIVTMVLNKKKGKHPTLALTLLTGLVVMVSISGSHSGCFLCLKDISVMSKIYDTLGRKYKDKTNDGTQDLGVCLLSSFCLTYLHQR